VRYRPSWQGGMLAMASEWSVKPLLCIIVSLLSSGEVQAQTRSTERIVESVIPGMDNNSSCSSVVSLQNLGSREIDAEVETHKNTGALASLVGHSGIQVHLGAGEQAEFKLQLPEEATGAWVRVREKIPAPTLSPVLAVSGTTECLATNALQTTIHEVAWPVRNPSFSADVSPADDGVISFINTSERPARVWGCYSSGVLYSVPHGEGTVLTPLCSETIEELVPPFGSRRFPVARRANSHFSLITRGDAIVLQMLRPSQTGVKTYRVDSTITFGEVVSGR
jgi:hypothetical protein